MPSRALIAGATASAPLGAQPAAASATLPANGHDQAAKRTSEPAQTTSVQYTPREKSSISFRAEVAGRELARYGLVVVVGWIGLMKFTAYEAEGIRPFVANSPLMSWGYDLFGVRGFSAVLGIVEVAIAVLIAMRWFSPRASAVGSALAVGMFVTTLSFLVTTPGVWEPSAGGFPALSAIPGQFLIKDLALLGISLWTLGAGWMASEQRR
jgi:uncharacterized membrane protein YkgB